MTASVSEKPQPSPRGAYRAFRTIGTRWMDNDAYGHVNNVVYYSWFDTVVNAHLIENGALDIQHGAVIGGKKDGGPGGGNFQPPVRRASFLHAGAGHRALRAAVEEHELRRVFEVVFGGVLRLVRAAAGAAAEQRGGGGDAQQEEEFFHKLQGL